MARKFGNVIEAFVNTSHIVGFPCSPKQKHFYVSPVLLRVISTSRIPNYHVSQIHSLNASYILSPRRFTSLIVNASEMSSSHLIF